MTDDKIKLRLELPYDVMTISDREKYFSIRFLQLDDSDVLSAKRYGITGTFGIVFKSPHFNCDFPITASIGNVYRFYNSLAKAYDTLDGKAALDDYSRPLMTVQFARTGHCEIDAAFVEYGSDTQLRFTLSSDQTYIKHAITNMEILFRALKGVQDSDIFY